MTHIKRVDEMNMPTKFNSVRHKHAVKLASELMNAYEDGDLSTAGDKWMKIYDLYEGETDIDATRELFDVMRIFPDNVVYDVTDYLKKTVNKMSKITEASLFGASMRYPKNIKVGTETKWGIFVGRFDIEQLRRKEDKKAVEDAKAKYAKEYVNTNTIKIGGATYLDIFVCDVDQWIL